MKRDEALAPLSRDHHSSLILAQLLKKEAPVYKGLPIEPKEKAKYALEQYQDHIAAHFAKEEIILDKASGCHSEIELLSNEIKNEHMLLADLFKSLNGADDLEDVMHSIGILLQDHIRKEERILFPLLQEHCQPELMAEIHNVVH